MAEMAHIGMTVCYLRNHAAIVTWVWTIDQVDLVYWDRASKQWVEVQNAWRGSQWSNVLPQGPS